MNHWATSGLACWKGLCRFGTLYMCGVCRFGPDDPRLCRPLSAPLANATSQITVVAQCILAVPPFTGPKKVLWRRTFCSTVGGKKPDSHFWHHSDSCLPRACKYADTRNVVYLTYGLWIWAQVSPFLFLVFLKVKCERERMSLQRIAKDRVTLKGPSSFIFYKGSQGAVACPSTWIQLGQVTSSSQDWHVAHLDLLFEVTVQTTAPRGRPAPPVRKRELLQSVMLVCLQWVTSPASVELTSYKTFHNET